MELRESFCVRLTPSERALIEAAADREQRRPSELVRAAALNRARRTLREARTDGDEVRCGRHG